MEGCDVVVGIGKETRPVEVVRGLHVGGVAFGGAVGVGKLEVAGKIIDGLVELVVGVVDEPHVVVGEGVGVIGIEA